MFSFNDTNTLHFKDFGQPLETQICIFVGSTKKFQTMLGIGSPLTEAVSETFFKLPKDKQQEILKAYYSKDKEIGYTLARTNIGSYNFFSM